jgi:hypothetical protein
LPTSTSAPPPATSTSAPQPTQPAATSVPTTSDHKKDTKTPKP